VEDGENAHCGWCKHNRVEDHKQAWWWPLLCLLESLWKQGPVDGKVVSLFTIVKSGLPLLVAS
jgi:hypothetical protein